MSANPPKLIALFGATGTGKTTFVNDASGANFKVGGTLESCTRNIVHTNIFQVDGQNIALFDTPGFDDTELSDTDILRRIAAFLTSTYKQGHKLTGIIYLHRINDNRFGGISRRTFKILRGLCGQETLSNVLIVTNIWSDPPTETEMENERQLRENPKFFQPAIEAGARMVRRPHKDSKSAHDVIRMLLDKPPVIMRIQRQIVDQGEGFHTTDAAIVLGEELAMAEERYLKEIEEVKEELREAREQNDVQAQSELREFLQQATAQSMRLSKEIESLREGFEQERLRWETRVNEAEAAQMEAERKQEEMLAQLEDLKVRAEQANGEERRRLEKVMEELLKQMEKLNNYKSKRKKCDEKRPICSRCMKVDSACVWPSSHHISDPQTELSFDSQTSYQKLQSSCSERLGAGSIGCGTEKIGSSTQPGTDLGIKIDSGPLELGFEPIINGADGSSMAHYHDPNSILADGYRIIDTRSLATSSKLWEYSQEYGPKLIWPPTGDEEQEGFDPEGIMPLVQRSISVLRASDDPIFQDVREFFATFLTRFFYDYAAIHESLHIRIRRRFGASNTLRQGMLGMAALFRSNYGQSPVPVSMRNYAKELHRLASHTLQLELENNNISPWIKLAGLWELMNYEYYAGNLSSYYPHLNQAASIVRLATGSNNIDLLKLSGEPTFDLRCFAWADILSSMALSRPTLLSYESDIHNPALGDFADPDKGVEWIFGCPDILAILLARTSALRHTRISAEEKMTRGREIQQLMQDWRFRPVFSQHSVLRVARVAAQEIWRHAAILYVHQSIFKSDFSHPLVKNSVKSIIQTASTLTRGANPDCFLPVPYFIAGSFATTPKDRHILRSRILTSGNESFLRNLVVALDDLWRETDVTGSMTTWSEQHPPRIMF